MTRRHPLWRVLALLSTLTLFLAACGDDDEEAESGDDTTTTEAEEETTTTEAEDDVESTTTEPEDDEEPSGGGGDGSLAGMRGTTPLVELSQDFQDRLLEIDPELVDFNYSGETYDAIVIIALAVEAEGNDDVQYAARINDVTREGEKCDSYESCLALLDGGSQDIDYDGVTGTLEFSGNGEPTEASYGVLEFGDDNRLDDELTEFRTATAPAEADVEQVPVEGNRTGDGTLTIGTILPETGSLAFLGPPEFAGAELAVADINAAGGVLDNDVVLIQGDSGDTSTDIANQTVDRLLGEDVDAIVGAASSGVSLTVIDKITGAGVVQFSPANTSKALSDYADSGLYFRTAPSDILQGQVVGEVIVDDGAATVGILALDDPYGTGLAEDLEAALTESGAEVLETIIYDPQAQTFDAEVGDIAALDPDAIVVIGFEESSRILTTMIEQGIGPQDKMVYGTDGNMGNALGESFEAGE